MQTLELTSVSASDARKLNEAVRPILEGLFDLVRDMEHRGFSRRKTVYSMALKACNALYYLNAELSYESIDRGPSASVNKDDSDPQEGRNHFISIDRRSSV